MSHYCIYDHTVYGLRGDNDDDDNDLCNNRYDARVDFHYHAESVLLGKSPILDESLLDADLGKVSVQPASEKASARLFELMRAAAAANKDGHKWTARLAKALVCWQCQFDDLAALATTLKCAHRIVVGEDDNGDGEFTSSLGDFQTASGRTSSLVYAIHSGSLAILRLMVEKHGTRLVYKRDNGSVINPLSVAIRANRTHLLPYLLDKCFLEDPDSVACMADESLGVATLAASLASLPLLLDFLLAHDLRLDTARLVAACKLASLKLAATEHQLDLKLRLFRLAFDHFHLHIGTRIKPPSSSAHNSAHNITTAIGESLFAVCFEFTQPAAHTLLVDLLHRHHQTPAAQDILVETFMSKMKRSFDGNHRLIEILLQHIGNKKLLYNKLVRYDKGRLIKPCENHLKSPKWPATSTPTNSYFAKQQLLVKYDIVPINKRVFWLANFIYHWTIVCSSSSGSSQRRSLATISSAASALRFVSADEMVELVAAHYGHLVANGLISVRRRASIAWWFDLKSRGRVAAALSAHDKARIERCLVAIYEQGRRTPMTLKMIARNRVRFLLVALSNEALRALRLPAHLVDYIRNDTL